MSPLWDHMMFEGVKVSRQLLLFGWDFQGVQEQGPMLSALKGGANTSRKGGGGGMLKSLEAVGLFEMGSGVPRLPSCYKHPQYSNSSFVKES